MKLPHNKKHRHADHLIVGFLPDLGGNWHRQYYDAVETLNAFRLLGVKITMQLLTTDTTKGLNLTITEILAATGQVFPSSGPFQVDVTDPTVDAGGANSGIVVDAGSADQATPTNFKASGNGKTGTITVKVTDTGNGLVGSSSFDVVAPVPPPPKADTLNVGFVAAT